MTKFVFPLVVKEGNTWTILQSWPDASTMFIRAYTTGLFVIFIVSLSWQSGVLGVCIPKNKKIMQQILSQELKTISSLL